MSTNFEAALAGEIRDLESALEADPRFQKLRELKRIQSLYSGGSTGPRVQATPATPSRRMPSPERQKILEQAKAVIMGRSSPTSTTEIYEAISGHVEIPGGNPKNNLSAMLSNSSEFISHGRTGWTLVSETPEATGDLSSGSAPAASMSSTAWPAVEPSVRPVDPVPGGGT